MASEEAALCAYPGCGHAHALYPDHCPECCDSNSAANCIHDFVAPAASVADPDLLAAVRESALGKHAAARLKKNAAPAPAADRTPGKPCVCGASDCRVEHVCIGGVRVNEVPAPAPDGGRSAREFIKETNHEALQRAADEIAALSARVAKLAEENERLRNDLEIANACLEGNHKAANYWKGHYDAAEAKLREARELLKEARAWFDDDDYISPKIDAALARIDGEGKK